MEDLLCQKFDGLHISSNINIDKKIDFNPLSKILSGEESSSIKSAVDLVVDYLENKKEHKKNRLSCYCTQHGFMRFDPELHDGSCEHLIPQLNSILEVSSDDERDDEYDADTEEEYEDYYEEEFEIEPNSKIESMEESQLDFLADDCQYYSEDDYDEANFDM
ncbi:hypothetical protein [Carp edema virus]|nr:hypothetical protein [Carp edema virus]